MKKIKTEKAKKTYLFYDEYNDDDYFYYDRALDPGCLEFEEKLLTNFRNKDKIKRKENNW